MRILHAVTQMWTAAAAARAAHVFFLFVQIYHTFWRASVDMTDCINRMMNYLDQMTASSYFYDIFDFQITRMVSTHISSADCCWLLVALQSRGLHLIRMQTESSAQHLRTGFDCSGKKAPHIRDKRHMEGSFYFCFSVVFNKKNWRVNKKISIHRKLIDWQHKQQMPLCKLFCL